MTASLQYFPNDVLKIIFSYSNSSLKTLAPLASVCKRWNELLKPIMDHLILEQYSIEKRNLELFKRKQRIRPLVLHNLEKGIKCKKSKIEFNIYLDSSCKDYFTPFNRTFFSYFIAQKLHIIALKTLEIIDLETEEIESLQIADPSTVVYPPHLPLAEYTFNPLILTHYSGNLLMTKHSDPEKFISIFDKQQKNLTFICERESFLDAWEKYVILYRKKQIEVVDTETKQVCYSMSFPNLYSHALHQNRLVVTDHKQIIGIDLLNGKEFLKKVDLAIEKIGIIDSHLFAYQSGLRTIRVCKFEDGKQIYRLDSASNVIGKEIFTSGFGKIAYSSYDVLTVFPAQTGERKDGFSACPKRTLKTLCIFQDRLITQSDDGNQKINQIYDLRRDHFVHIKLCENSELELDPAKLSMIAIHRVFNKKTGDSKHKEDPSLLDLISGKTFFVNSNHFDIPLENQDQGPILLTSDEYCIALYYKKVFVDSNPEEKKYQITFTLDIQHLAIPEKALTQKCNGQPEQAATGKVSIRSFQPSKLYAAIFFPILCILCYYSLKTNKPF